MHLLFSVGSLLLLILCLSRLLQLLLKPIHDWEQRRILHQFLLFLPTLSWLVLPAGLWHLFDSLCIRTAPSWDQALDIGVIVLFSASIPGSIVLGSIRLCLMQMTMKRQFSLCHPPLEARVKRFTSKHGIASVRLHVVSSPHPLSLTYGLWHPTLVVSTWMAEHLDQEELEAVLTHEIAHIRRADYRRNWIALLLRDAFFYLPSVRSTYHHLQQERELACDDLVTQMTHRPLVLASALTKVWLHMTEDASVSLAQTLAGSQKGLEYRITRLLAASSTDQQQLTSFSFSSRMGISYILFALVSGAGCFWMIALLQCWPIFSRLFW